MVLITMIMFHGTEDRIVRYKEFALFVDKMKGLENDFISYTFENAGHFDVLNDVNYERASGMIDEFLKQHGLMVDIE